VAVGEDDRAAARSLGRVQAAEALARAALFSGATVLVAEDQESPAGEPMPDSPVPEPFAALRWPRENPGAGLA
jgi:hypothetical protein